MATKADTTDISKIFNDDARFKTDIQAMKSFAAPPQGIIDTLAAVTLLLGRDTSWGTARKLMANPKLFMDMLKNFDKDNINPDAMQTVRDKYIKMSDFNPESMKQKAAVCVLLCKWVLAIDKYDRETKGQGGKTAE